MKECLNKLPDLLDVPEKLYPFICGINDYKVFLLEGGRGSAKSHSAARLISFIAGKNTVRVCCGRETQATIEDSVYKLFSDLIGKYKLNFKVQSSKIIHNETNSSIIFKGFREQGKVNIKGLEGIDILWIDEAEAITAETLKIIMPTIRKQNAIVIFTMNRFVRDDPVFVYCMQHSNCLHLKINYYENKHCPKDFYNEAEDLKVSNYKEWLHIYGGEPLDQAQDYLFSSSKLDYARDLQFKQEAFFHKCSCMSVDLAGGGGDLCVASLIESRSSTEWELSRVETWNEPNTDITKGKIINLYGMWKPDILILDGDGLGYPIYISVQGSIEDTLKFIGAGQSMQKNAYNQRADGYLMLAHFINNGWLKITDKRTLKQLEYIKIEYSPNGLIKIQSKKDIKKAKGESPDFADSLMMAIYAINYHSHLFLPDKNIVTEIQTDFDPYT